MSAAEFNRRQREKRIATCRHFTGIMNDACEKGVVYRSVRDTSGPGMAKWPCTDADCPTACNKREPRTAEEVDAEDREFEERLSFVGRARAKIVALKAPEGRTDCPRCGQGLWFRVSSYNGHVHANCDTKDCLRWME